MPDDSDPRYLAAVQHFRDARQRADLEMLSARLTGKSADLLSFDDVRRRLKGSGEAGSPELRTIPLNAIVGSVGRYTDFTRTFLPRDESDRARWAAVRLAFASPRGVPPIHVYQVGEVYFVLDGNHRVSVARALQMDEIRAYVTPIESRVSLTPDMSLDDLIIVEEHADFLERTGLDDSCPDVDFTTTAPGRYQTLLEHIEVYRYALNQTMHSEISMQEAARRWCEEIYMPLVKIIRARGILVNFPGRTEADLCVWLARHRETLSKNVGWLVKPEAAAEDLVARFSGRPRRVARRLRQRLGRVMIPTRITAGPPTGQWRAERARSTRLFREILVPVSGDEHAWRALDQALVVAAREGAEVHGVYVLTNQVDTGAETALREAFDARTAQAQVKGSLHVQEGGTIADVIRSLGRWNDLMVLRLAHPPADLPIERLRSGFTNLIRTTSRPILAVPGDVSRLERPLLAYDGSPKAREALFVAAYLAGGWQIPLVVMAVSESARNAPLEQARAYLQGHGIEADYIDVRRRYKTVSRHILETIWAHERDFVIMGGYGFNPVFEIALGSAVDSVLRHSRMPVLICR